MTPRWAFLSVVTFIYYSVQFYKFNVCKVYNYLVYLIQRQNFKKYVPSNLIPVFVPLPLFTIFISFFFIFYVSKNFFNLITFLSYK